MTDRQLPLSLVRKSCCNQGGNRRPAPRIRQIVVRRGQNTIFEVGFCFFCEILLVPLAHLIALGIVYLKAGIQIFQSQRPIRQWSVRGAENPAGFFEQRDRGC